MNNEELIEKFYKSFANDDIEGMVSCYDRNVYFKDPVFGRLKGEDAKDMWRMLISRNKGAIKITYKNIKANDKKGSAYWEAEYVFSQTGRKVINKVNARFRFKDGKIVKHTDDFNLWKWSRQAIGFKGFLFGWTSLFKSKIQKKTIGLLNAFQTKRVF